MPQKILIAESYDPLRRTYVLSTQQRFPRAEVEGVSNQLGLDKIRGDEYAAIIMDGDIGLDAIEGLRGRCKTPIYAIVRDPESRDAFLDAGATATFDLPGLLNEPRAREEPLDDFDTLLNEVSKHISN